MAIVALVPAVHASRFENLRLREQALRGEWAGDREVVLGCPEEINPDEIQKEAMGITRRNATRPRMLSQPCAV